MAWDADLEARVRGDLADWPIKTKRMFGGLAILTGGHMICGIYHGGIFLRGAPGPGTAPLVMGGSGREMRGFALMLPETAAEDSQRRSLIGAAAALAARLPPKQPKPRGKARKTPL